LSLCRWWKGGEEITEIKRPRVQEAQPVRLGVPDVARALSIGRTEVFMMIRRGDLRSLKIGRRRLVPVSELHRFAEAGLTLGKD